MKKIAMMLALAAAPFTFVSCGDDNEDDKTLTLDKSNITLLYGQQDELKANIGKGVWGTTDRFVADVDAKGKVTGMHLGEATVTYTVDGKEAKCKVTVNPTEEGKAFELPYLGFGQGISAVKDAMKAFTNFNLFQEDSDLLQYNVNGTLPFYTYTFSASGKLNGASIADNADKSQKTLRAFLDQRYEEVKKEDGVTYFVDGFGYDDPAASVEVSVSFVEGETAADDLIMAMWLPLDEVKSGLDRQAVLNAHKAALKAAMRK